MLACRVNAVLVVAFVEDGADHGRLEALNWALLSQELSVFLRCRVATTGCSHLAWGVVSLLPAQELLTIEL